MGTPAVTPEDVRAAAAVLDGHIARTPCIGSEALSRLAGCEVVLKFENLHCTGSFKERGALNKLLGLTDAERARGVVAMSAGNHAQGVAHHATRLGVAATIVMPRLTPFVKVANTERLGARVVLEGAGLEQAADYARGLAEREGLTLIHPYDDPLVIAGQGTVGLEVLAARPDLDALIVPIGGGGLIAGIATAVKALKPGIEIFGVEAALYPSVRCRLEGRPAPAGGPTIAEGIAVKAPGRLTLPVIRRHVAEVLLVEEGALEVAIQTLIEVEKTVVEGAGAAVLAALLGNRGRFAGRRVGLVLSGGNIDSRLLSAVLLRGLVRSRRLIRLRVGAPDSPGSLARITTLVAERGGNIVEVYHQRAFSQLSVKSADVDLVVETQGARHAVELEEALRAAGFAVRTTDEAIAAGGP